MPTSKNVRDTPAWKQAQALVDLVNGLTRAWPRNDQYQIADQIRRAAAHVPAQIAAGHAAGAAGREQLGQAQGALREVETHLRVAERLGYVQGPDAARVRGATKDVSRALDGLARTLADQ